jgi:hypothetical protein
MTLIAVIDGKLVYPLFFPLEWNLTDISFKHNKYLKFFLAFYSNITVLLNI